MNFTDSAASRGPPHGSPPLLISTPFLGIQPAFLSPQAEGIPNADVQTTVQSPTSLTNVDVGALVGDSGSAKIIAELCQQGIIDQQGQFTPTSNQTTSQLEGLTQHDLFELSELLKRPFDVRLHLTLEAQQRVIEKSRLYKQWAQMGFFPFSSDPAGTIISFRFSVSNLLLNLAAHLRLPETPQALFTLTGSFKDRILRHWYARSFERLFNINPLPLGLLPPHDRDIDIQYFNENADMSVFTGGTFRIQQFLAGAFAYAVRQGNPIPPSEDEFNTYLEFVQLIFPVRSEYNPVQRRIYSNIVVGSFDFTFYGAVQNRYLFKSDALNIPLRGIISDISDQIRAYSDRKQHRPYNGIGCKVIIEAPFETICQALIDQQTKLLHFQEGEVAEPQSFLRTMAKMTKEGSLSSVSGQLERRLRTLCPDSGFNRTENMRNLTDEELRNVAELIIKFGGKHLNLSSSSYARTVINALVCFRQHGVSNEVVAKLWNILSPQLQISLPPLSLEAIIFKELDDNQLPFDVLVACLQLVAFFKLHGSSNAKGLEHISLVVHEGLALQIGKEQFIVIPLNAAAAWKKLSTFILANSSNHSSVCRCLESFKRVLVPSNQDFSEQSQVKRNLTVLKPILAQLQAMILEDGRTSSSILPLFVHEVMVAQRAWDDGDEGKAFSLDLMPILMNFLVKAGLSTQQNLLELYGKVWKELIASSYKQILKGIQSDKTQFGPFSRVLGYWV